MQWELIRDMKFFAGSSDKYTILKKGDIYSEVGYSQMTRSIKESLARHKRKSQPNQRFVILNAENKQRLFVVGKDVIPHSTGVQGLWKRKKLN